MIHKVKITFKVINLERVPGSCIRKKEFLKKTYLSLYTKCIGCINILINK